MGQTLTGPGITDGTTIIGIGDGIEYSTSYLGPYETIIPLKSPWGIYRAKDYNPSKGTIPEARGNGYDVTVVNGGGAITTGASTGHGATATVNWIAGNTGTKMLWPAYPFAAQTICSVTRYVDSGGSALLSDALNPAWVHGHWAGYSGVAMYGVQSTAMASTGAQTDWVVMCGKSPDAQFPGNFLANGIPVGISTGVNPGSVLKRLAMNANGNSNWAFLEVVIWNQLLTGERRKPLCI